MYFASKSYFPPEEREEATVGRNGNNGSMSRLPLRTSLAYSPLSNKNLLGSSITK